MREIMVGYGQDLAHICRKLSKDESKVFLYKRMHLIDSLGFLSQQTEGIAEIIHNSREITKVETQREK